MTQTITVRGRPSQCLRRRGTRQLGSRWHSCIAVGQSLEALEPVRQGVHRCFGAIAPGVACGLKLRHDHGFNYMSGDFQDEIECLGDRSFALLRATARGQRRRRALHPNLEREPAVGENLRHHRRAASRTRRVRGSLQRNLAAVRNEPAPRILALAPVVFFAAVTQVKIQRAPVFLSFQTC